MSTEKLYEVTLKLADIAGNRDSVFAETLESVKQLRKECADIRQQWQEHHREARHEPEG